MALTYRQIMSRSEHNVAGGSAHRSSEIRPEFDRHGAESAKLSRQEDPGALAGNTKPNVRPAPQLARRNPFAIDPASIAFDETLPIASHRAEIAAAIKQNQVLVVCGETGSGKTTQLPKILLQCGYGQRGVIGHTQPRRIAARTVAARIASELGVKLGEAVGYSVRFSDVSRPETIVRVMTDGLLLAECERDRHLRRYEAMIIDEAHERSLNIDLLLGYLKSILPKRPDFRLIITSATIDPKRLSDHFASAPVISVGGRTFPVDIQYKAHGNEQELDEDEPAVMESIAAAIHETEFTASPDAPDVLVFLSGEREIREVARFLSGRLSPRHEILPLYARLSAREQNRVFEPHTARRVVLATNVAETSLTVPRIGVVIDPGLARIGRYSPAARVQRLPIEPISQASARQRAGRCGRIAPGLCIRLYSEADHNQRPAFTDPEILRSNLASVILQMKALRLGPIEEFPFIDQPRPSSVRAGLLTLHELNALDSRGDLTPIGQRLSKLPVDPRFGRMIIEAAKRGAVRETLVIVSALAVQDPRMRPIDHTSLADAAHAEFVDDRSDFMAFLRLWEWWQRHSKERSSSSLRRLCESRYLSYVRFREWVDIHRQLHALAMSAGMHGNATPARYDQIHLSLLSGLLSNIGQKTESQEYRGVSERAFSIFPGSALFRRQPRWVMAAELIETSRLYVRTVAKVHPEWVEQLAPHLVRKSYTAPFWNRTTAHVEAHERVALRGVTLIPKRRVHYGRIDPGLAREVFIQQALVEGEYQTPATKGRRSEIRDDAIAANRALIKSVRDLEHKTRRHDILIGPERLFALYDARVPAHVCNGPAFEKWRRKAEKRDSRVLRFTRADVTENMAIEIADEEFPAMLEWPGVKLPLEYRHEPGHPDDGVTAIVPLEAMRQLSRERCEWIVPGLLQEKITALIKALPKSLRMHFAPASKCAENIVQHIVFGVGVLTEAVARELDRTTGVRIPREAWRFEVLPPHLRLNLRVIDETGSTIASGRDLSALREAVSQVPQHVHSLHADLDLNRSGLTHWDFDELPPQSMLHRNGSEVMLHSAVVDEGQTVGVRLFKTAREAQNAWRAGLRRLYSLHVREEVEMHVDYLPGIDHMTLLFAPLATKADSIEFRDELIDLIVDRVFLRDDVNIRTGEEFRRRLDSGWDQLWNVASATAGVVTTILEQHHEVEIRLCGASENPFLSHAVSDIRMQLCGLMPPRFLTRTPWRCLVEFPRFLKAIVIRMQKLANAGLDRDRRNTQIVQDWWNRYRATQPIDSDGLQSMSNPRHTHFRWMLEELRVSLFAQELRTSEPVSVQRLERLWSKLEPLD